MKLIIVHEGKCVVKKKNVFIKIPKYKRMLHQKDYKTSPEPTLYGGKLKKIYIFNSNSYLQLSIAMRINKI